MNELTSKSSPKKEKKSCVIRLISFYFLNPNFYGLFALQNGEGKEIRKGNKEKGMKAGIQYICLDKVRNEIKLPFNICGSLNRRNRLQTQLLKSISSQHQ